MQRFSVGALQQQLGAESTGFPCHRGINRTEDAQLMIIARFNVPSRDVEQHMRILLLRSRGAKQSESRERRPTRLLTLCKRIFGYLRVATIHQLLPERMFRKSRLDDHLALDIPAGVMRVGQNELSLWCNVGLDDAETPIVVRDVLVEVKY